MKSDFLILVLFMILVVAVAGGIAWMVESAACSRKAVSFQGHKYSLLTGCMVEHKGMLLPLENIRGFD